MGYKYEYAKWLEQVKDEELLKQLSNMDDAEIEDAFYRDLDFGTGGLRGVIGAGTNRMNVYVVAKVSQGLANYVKANFSQPSIAVSYDNRIKSDLFARVASSVFAANDIQVHVYTELMPTPCLSYAVRALSCSAGIMITASHNPANYNGYKVYDNDGCQITTEAAAKISAEIEKVDTFVAAKYLNFAGDADSSLINHIDTSVYTAFTNEVLNQSVLFGDEINRDIVIVYTPE